MPVKCPSCNLLFRTSNELDWHAREEHLRSSLPARTPPTDHVTAPADRTEPVAVAGTRTDRDDPPPPDPSEPTAASTASGGPLAWLRSRLRTWQAARNPPR
jgi:hypothetical protein